MKGEGRPGIMWGRGTLVDPQYQIDPNAESGSEKGVLNPSLRKASSGDVKHILGLQNVTTKRFNLGQATNNFYDEDGYKELRQGEAPPPIKE